MRFKLKHDYIPNKGNRITCSHAQENSGVHTSSRGGLFKSPGQMLIKWTFTAKLNPAFSGVFLYPGMFVAL